MERRRSRKLFGSFFPSLARNRMRNKQEAAEEWRAQKHSIILDTTELQGKGIWRAIKMLEERNLIASLMIITVRTVKGLSRFLATKDTFCRLFSFYSTPFLFPFLFSSPPCFSLSLPLCTILPTPVPSCLSIPITEKYIPTRK